MRTRLLSLTRRAVAQQPRFRPQFFTAERQSSTSAEQGQAGQAGQQEQQQQQNGSGGGGAAAGEAAADPQKEHEALVAKLQKDIKELKDQIVRSYAEEENVRRIAKKDVESARQYGNASFAKHMLDVADNLERAMEAVPEQTRTELKAGSGDAHLRTLFEGIQMTEKGLQKAFAQNGVVKFGLVGDTFDPALHDALYSSPQEGKKAGTIAAVLKAGYKLKDRVIRPAQVGTVSA